jgi:3-oxoacyl-[acyl-carrier protein] reductase
VRGTRAIDETEGLKAVELVGQSAVVTGGAQGIGLGIARALIAHGSGVVLFDRNEEAVSAAAASLGERAVGVAGSVTSAADIGRALDAAAAAFGPPTLLVNSAGVGFMTLIVDTPEEDWQALYDVCVKGTFLCTREFGRRAVAAKSGGAVVNVSSLNAFAASEGIGHYASAKAAVSQFTKVAALEFAPHGIRVNAVAPGLTRTPMSEGGFLSGRMLEEFLAHTPLGRVGEPEDVAKVVVFLCSDYAEWVTGVTLSVDGGSHIRGLHNYWAVAQEGVSA